MSAENGTCPVEVTLSLIGNKWKVLVLRDLARADLRFGELETSLAGISRKVLSRNLRELVEDGVVERIGGEEESPRPLYRLSELGRSLGPVVGAMGAWGAAYKARIGMTA